MPRDSVTGRRLPDVAPVPAKVTVPREGFEVYVPSSPTEPGLFDKRRLDESIFFWRRFWLRLRKRARLIFR